MKRQQEEEEEEENVRQLKQLITEKVKQRRKPLRTVTPSSAAGASAAALAAANATTSRGLGVEVDVDAQVPLPIKAQGPQGSEHQFFPPPGGKGAARRGDLLSSRPCRAEDLLEVPRNSDEAPSPAGSSSSGSPLMNGGAMYHEENNDPRATGAQTGKKRKMRLREAAEHRLSFDVYPRRAVSEEPSDARGTDREAIRGTILNQNVVPTPTAAETAKGAGSFSFFGTEQDKGRRRSTGGSSRGRDEDRKMEVDVEETPRERTSLVEGRAGPGAGAGSAFAPAAFKESAGTSTAAAPFLFQASARGVAQAANGASGSAGGSSSSSNFIASLGAHTGGFAALASRQPGSPGDGRSFFGSSSMSSATFAGAPAASSSSFAFPSSSGGPGNTATGTSEGAEQGTPAGGFFAFSKPGGAPAGSSAGGQGIFGFPARKTASSSAVAVGSSSQMTFASFGQSHEPSRKLLGGAATIAVVPTGSSPLPTGSPFPPPRHSGMSTSGNKDNAMLFGSSPGAPTPEFGRASSSASLPEVDAAAEHQGEDLRSSPGGASTGGTAGTSPANVVLTMSQAIAKAKGIMKKKLMKTGCQSTTSSSPGDDEEGGTEAAKSKGRAYLLFQGSCKAFQLCKETGDNAEQEEVARWRLRTDAGQVRVYLDKDTGSLSVSVRVRGTWKFIFDTPIVSADSIKPVGDNSVSFLGTTTGSAESEADQTKGTAQGQGHAAFYRLNLLGGNDRQAFLALLQGVCAVLMPAGSSSGGGAAAGGLSAAPGAAGVKENGGGGGT